ncbi:DUF2971 domain-containing protein [Vibrio splendidus]|uniref:DUF2971 domain-containing protein n=1 Tax=Vibrio splendidus TaxID=29497 RepID=UPI00148DDAB8|nr:DUF2971 domain-containing protein [Vibrio splendidus]NOJ09626.1 DUF2971 domain-containing protein [Vibrio splendidus]
MKLYKFQTVNENSLAALSEFSLYFARSEQMNDPTENMFRLLEFNKNDMYSPDISVLNEMGILSMAIGEKSLIEESPFMWAHYGNELKGFCLVFDFSKFVVGIENDVEKFGHIQYKRFPRLLSGDNLINENSGLENVAGTNFQENNLNRVYEVCFFDKPADFEHEQEFRFITQSCGLKPYKPQSLLSVIIGEKMCVEDRDKLLSVVEKLGIEHKIKVAKVKENSFKIHVTSGEENL